MKKIAFGLLLILIIFPTPWLLLHNKVVDRQQYLTLEQTKVGLIFGTIMSGEIINPLAKERLEMGMLLYKNNKIEKIVVSNTYQSSLVMKNYLLEKGIPAVDIIVDQNAVITRDSCSTDYIRGQNHSILFISQSFHLPRVLYECGKFGVTGVAVPAEYADVIDRSNTSLYDIVTIRFTRYMREIIILWGDIILQSYIFT